MDAIDTITRRAQNAQTVSALGDLLREAGRENERLEEENERLRESNANMLRTLHQIVAHQRIVGGAFAQHGTTYQLAAKAIDAAMK